MEDVFADSIVYVFMYVIMSQFCKCVCEAYVLDG